MVEEDEKRSNLFPHYTHADKEENVVMQFQKTPVTIINKVDVAKSNIYTVCTTLYINNTKV